MSEEPRNTGILIRPMGIGEVLDAGFSLGRNNFRLLVTIAAWGVIPGQALSASAAAIRPVYATMRALAAAALPMRDPVMRASMRMRPHAALTCVKRKACALLG